MSYWLNQMCHQLDIMCILLDSISVLFQLILVATMFCWWCKNYTTLKAFNGGAFGGQNYFHCLLSLSPSPLSFLYMCVKDSDRERKRKPIGRSKLKCQFTRVQDSTLSSTWLFWLVDMLQVLQRWTPEPWKCNTNYGASTTTSTKTDREKKTSKANSCWSTSVKVRTNKSLFSCRRLTTLI